MYAFMAVETEIPWSAEEQSVQFDGHLIRIRPGTDSRRADIAVEYGPGQSLEDAVRIGNAFLSELAWQTKLPIRVEQHCGASFPDSGIGTLHSQHISEHFRLDFKPKLETKKQRLALSLFREAKGVKSVPYAVLGFYKIIRLLFPSDRKGQEQMLWINNNLNKITEYRAQSRLKDLSSSVADIGKYVYVDVRCALAHANQQPVVNPDDSRALLRLHQDLPLVEALAKIAIEHELGVQSEFSFRNDHKYELSGFLELLRWSLKKLRQGRNVLTKVPRLQVSIRMRDKPQLSAFKNLELKQIDMPASDIVRLLLISQDALVQVLLCLDSKSTRMYFNPVEGARINDDGSAAAMQYNIDRNTIVMDWLCNGATEVVSSDGKLLARSDPFVPCNLNVSDTLQSFRESSDSYRSEYSRRFLNSLVGG
jgi:hypothetical protein